jgi:hypothetical protein
MAKISVQSYAGFKADERPVSFTLGAHIFHVREIVDRWYGEDHSYFKLIADDGNLYVIRHDRAEDQWEMVLMEAAREE